MAQPTAAEIDKFLAGVAPAGDGPSFRVEALDDRTVRLRLGAEAQHLRPGQTVSGPTMFVLCDAVGWIMVLRNRGLESMMSVTSSLNINFLSRPKPTDLIAEGRLLKLGRRQAVSEVLLYSEGDAEPVAQATVTYAIVMPKA